MKIDRALDMMKPGLFWVQNLRNRVVMGVTLGVRALVTDEEGGILLVRHSYIPGWHFPGGAVEPGETALASLERELLEETGLSADGPSALLGLYFNERHAGRDHVALYRMEATRRVRPFVPNAEIREAGFFPPSDLPADASGATRRRIGEHLFGAVVSDRW